MASIGSPLGSIISGIMGQNQQDWYKGALVNVLNNLNQANSTGWNYGMSQFGAASPAAQSLLGLAPQLLFGHDGTPGSMTGMQDQLQSTMGGINQGQFQGSGLTPQMQSALDAMSGQAGGTGNAQSLMNNVIANGGGSSASQSIWDNLNNLATGQGANNSALSQQAFNLLMNPQSGLTQTLQGQGQNVVGQGGMTPGLNTAQSALQYIMNQGGSNSNIDSGMQQALGMMSGQSPIISQLSQSGANGMASNLGVAGLTNTGAMGETAALQGLQNQGQTGTSQFLANRGQQLASQDAVLPAMLAANFARDEATGQYKNAAQAAQEQAMARGGGPGSLVANGTSNEALADFADKGASGISNAVQQSLLNSQGLNLQQQGQGASMASQGGNLALGNLNDYSNLLSQLESSATNRYGVGGGLLGQAGSLSNQQSATGLGAVQNLSGLQSNNVLQALQQMQGVANSSANQAQTYGNLGLGAGNLQLGNQSLGGNLTNMLNQTSLAGLQGLQGNLNQANNYTLGATGALNNLTGTAGGLYNSMFGNNVNSGQLGLGQTSNYYNALNSLFGQSNTLTGNQLGMYGTGLNSLYNMGNAGINYANTANSGMPHIFSNYNASSANPLGNAINTASGQALSGIASGLGY